MWVRAKCREREVEMRKKARVGGWPTPDATDTDAASSAAQRLLAIAGSFLLYDNRGMSSCRTTN